MALLFQRILVSGPSMTPALRSGQRLLVGRLPYILAGPARGDIVVVHHPSRPELLLVKRVIALPGDRVGGPPEGIVGRGESTRDAADAPATNTTPVLGPGELLVAGDADIAGDRWFGPIPSASVVGKAWWCYWPWERWGPIPRAGPDPHGQRPTLQRPSVTAGRP